MSKSHSIDDFIKENKYYLAKYEAVKAVFPDARVNQYIQFSSKMVNKNYTKFEFQTRYGGLFILPYCEIPFTHDGKEEIIKIHSLPKATRLVYLRRLGDRTMKFSRLSINLKNNNFKEDMLNACCAEIMKFIAANPGYRMDDRHLEPRLKKLLLFT